MVPALQGGAIEREDDLSHNTNRFDEMAVSPCSYHWSLHAHGKREINVTNEAVGKVLEVSFSILHGRRWEE